MPRIVSLILKIMLLLGVFQFFTVLISVFYIYGIAGLDRLIVFIVILISSTFFVLSVFGLFSTDDETRFGLCLTMLILSLSVIGIDQYLTAKWIWTPLADFADERGQPFDRRWVSEVVLDERNDGKQSFPDLTPRVFYERPLKVEGKTVSPLAGIANVETVLCNEDGKYRRYKSDRYGFNNSDFVWDNAGVFDVVLIGDSFAQGWCVAPDQTASANLNKLKTRSVSFGHGGLGPIGALAMIREYLPRVKSRNVAWLWYEGNDRFDFNDEISNPFISRYLEEPTYSQNLFAQREKIDRALRRYAEANLGSYEKVRWVPLFKWRTTVSDISVSKLMISWWEKVFLVNREKNVVPVKVKTLAKTDTRLLKAIERGMKEIRANGAVPIFIYLPSYSNFKSRSEINAKLKQDVFTLLAGMGVKTVDLRQVFQARNLPANKIFPFPIESHYTRIGHRVIAETIQKIIRSEKN